MAENPQNNQPTETRQTPGNNSDPRQQQRDEPIVGLPPQGPQMAAPTPDKSSKKDKKKEKKNEDQPYKKVGAAMEEASAEINDNYVKAMWGTLQIISKILSDSGTQGMVSKGAGFALKAAYQGVKNLCGLGSNHEKNLDNSAQDIPTAAAEESVADNIAASQVPMGPPLSMNKTPTLNLQGGEAAQDYEAAISQTTPETATPGHEEEQTPSRGEPGPTR